MYCRDALLLLCTLVLLLPCWSLPTLLEEQLYTTCFYDYNHRRCDVSAEAVLRLTPASSQAERLVAQIAAYRSSCARHQANYTACLADTGNSCYQAFGGCASSFGQDPMAMFCKDASASSQCASLLFTRGYSATSSRCLAIKNATSCLRNALCSWDPSMLACSTAPGAVFAAGLAGASPGIDTSSITEVSSSASTASGRAGPMTDSSSAAEALLPQRPASQLYNASAGFTVQYLQLWLACGSRTGRAACESSPRVAVLATNEQLLNLKTTDLGLVLPGAPQGPSARTYITLFMTVVPLLAVGVGVLALVMYVAWRLRRWQTVRQAGNREYSRGEGV